MRVLVSVPKPVIATPGRTTELPPGYEQVGSAAPISRREHKLHGLESYPLGYSRCLLCMQHFLKLQTFALDQAVLASRGKAKVKGRRKISRRLKEFAGRVQHTNKKVERVECV